MDSRRTLEESSSHGGLDTLRRKIKLPFVNELRLGRKPSDQLQAESLYASDAVAGLNLHFPGQFAPAAGEDVTEEKVLKDGVLSKTTITYKGDATKVGPSRQRNFRLTEGAIEYFHQFSLVKVKRSFPLTSIQKVDYNPDNEPTIFRLIFSNYKEILQADTPEEASDWVDKIRTECMKWCPMKPKGSILDDLSLSLLYEESEGEDEGQQEGEDPFPEITEATAVVEAEQAPEIIPVSQSIDIVRLRNEAKFAELRDKAMQHSDQAQAHPKKKRHFTAPSLLGWRKKLPEDLDKTKSDFELGKNFRMIKYPRHSFGLPSDKYFKLDPQTMQIMWRRNQRTRFQRSRTLSLHKVVEVRKGQRTRMFDKFPYEQAEGQSFSLIYEQEDKSYARLTALNVICNTKNTYNTWIDELESKVIPGQHQGFGSTHPKMSNEDNDTTDTTIQWLRQIWSCKSEDDEMAESTATKLVKKLNPFVPERHAKQLVLCAYKHQIDLTHKMCLGFQEFVLLFNLLNNIQATSSRLYSIFEEYAKSFPHLGLTIKEFRQFLVQECDWPRRNCRKVVLRRLMQTHDSCHQAFKKYVAKKKREDYVMGYNLLSFAGLLSFLRSQDNSAIDPEHETVYQDMTQPLSHYFINSSHNTYLEGDQIQGKSSTDAYVRTFLQGCRCVEIDCWNDTLNVNDLKEREPIIYHGYTLTTKIPFWEVIHTIREYAFINSDYPVVISIENHCNQDYQKKMAKIFTDIFGDMLPDVDLVKEENLNRLPSPAALKGKIILKGSFKNKDVAKESKQAKGFRQYLARMTSIPTSVPPTESLPPNAAATSRKSPATSVSPTESVEEHHDSLELSIDVDGEESLPVMASRRFERVNFLNGHKTETCELDDSYIHPEMCDTPSPHLIAQKSFHFPNEDSKNSTLDRFSRSLTLQNICNRVVQLEQGQDDQELEFNTTLGPLKSLIVYAKAISIKPWSWKKQKATSVTEMFSFGEPTARELCSEWSKDMLACTERQFVRTYPKGTRFDSSNYDPMPMWRCGVQMVSLNFQYPDTFMHLNQGFFRRNGGCGYVLKPAVMRREDPGGATGGSAPFSPDMKVPHPDVPPIDVEIELLSGQRLCPWKKKRSHVSVKIHTYGNTYDYAHIPEATHANMLWPQWGKEEHVLKKTILMPELCLVYFRVEADRKMFGQNCIPLVSLQTGIKFIPLRTPGGELIPGSGLFVKIKKKEVTGLPTKDETRENELAQDSTRRFSQLERQETVDQDDWENEEGMMDHGEVVNEAASKERAQNIVLQTKEAGTCAKEEDSDVVLSSLASRRYTSPALLDGGSEFNSITSQQQQLVTVVEVHEGKPDS